MLPECEGMLCCTNFRYGFSFYAVAEISTIRKDIGAYRSETCRKGDTGQFAAIMLSNIWINNLPPHGLALMGRRYMLKRYGR